jgi:hypothetical protein
MIQLAVRNDLILPRLAKHANPWVIINRLTTTCGLSWPRLWHNMRASCITDWVCNGHDLADAAAWAGHTRKILVEHYLRRRRFGRQVVATAASTLESVLVDDAAEIHDAIHDVKNSASEGVLATQPMTTPRSTPRGHEASRRAQKPEIKRVVRVPEPQRQPVNACGEGVLEMVKWAILDSNQ